MYGVTTHIWTYRDLKLTWFVDYLDYIGHYKVTHTVIGNNKVTKRYNITKNNQLSLYFHWGPFTVHYGLRPQHFIMPWGHHSSLWLKAITVHYGLRLGLLFKEGLNIFYGDHGVQNIGRYRGALMNIVR